MKHFSMLAQYVHTYSDNYDEIPGLFQAIS